MFYPVFILDHVQLKMPEFHIAVQIFEKESCILWQIQKITWKVPICRISSDDTDTKHGNKFKRTNNLRNRKVEPQLEWGYQNLIK